MGMVDIEYIASFDNQPQLIEYIELDFLPSRDAVLQEIFHDIDRHSEWNGETERFSTIGKMIFIFDSMSKIIESASNEIIENH